VPFVAPSQRKSKLPAVFGSMVVLLLGLGGLVWWEIRRGTSQERATTAPPNVNPNGLSATTRNAQTGVAASNGDPAKLSDDELSQRRQALLVERERITSGTPAFQLMGKITHREAGAVTLVGRAIPTSGDPSILGVHGDDACLLVKAPESLGQFSFDRFACEECFYLGESEGTNAFGATVSCSVYGGASKDVMEKRVQLLAALQPYEGEVRRRHERAEQERATRENASRTLENQKSELAKLQSDLSGKEDSRSRLLQSIADNQRLLDRENALGSVTGPEAQRPDTRQRALKVLEGSLAAWQTALTQNTDEIAELRKHIAAIVPPTAAGLMDQGRTTATGVLSEASSEARPDEAKSTVIAPRHAKPLSEQNKRALEGLRERQNQKPPASGPAE
jgi:hypothetical protein